MKVKEVMSGELRGVRKDNSLRQAAEVMRLLDVGSLPVVSPEDSRVVGIITDRDMVVRGVAGSDNVSEQKVGDLMSTPLVCCNEEDEIEQAAAAMKAMRVRRVLVTNRKNQPVGLVSLGDLVQATINPYEVTNVVRHVSTPTGS